MPIGVIAADPVGILAAFGAGVISFLSPCVLPLVPGYLSLVSGLSAAELGSSKPAQPASRSAPRSPSGSTSKAAPSNSGPESVAARHLALVGAAGATTAAANPRKPAATGSAGALDARSLSETPVADAGGPAAHVRGRPLGPLLRGILLFIAGFTVVFVALGATASGVGHLLTSHKDGLITVSGGVVVVLGVVMLASSLPAGVWIRLGPRLSGRVGWLVGERRFHFRPRTFGVFAAPVMGMAFAFAWTPCIGPVLGAVLALTLARSTLGGGVLLLFAYSLGLGVPFLVTGLAFDRLTGFYARARKPLAIVQGLAGAVLVAFGAVLLAGDLGWLSAQFSSLLDHLGLHRLTVS